jgi:hypothetical protein
MMRKGVTLTESLVALATAGAAAMLLAQFLFVAAKQRRADEQRRLALTEVANRLEQAAVLPWDDLTSQRLEQAPLSEAARAALPSARLTAQITDETAEVPCRRIRVEVSWADTAGRPVTPVGISSWRFAAPGEQP